MMELEARTQSTLSTAKTNNRPECACLLQGQARGCNKESVPLERVGSRVAQELREPTILSAKDRHHHCWISLARNTVYTAIWE